MTPVEYMVGFFSVAFLCLLIVNGILLNAFIIVVNLNSWTKSQPLQAIDLIITSLAIVRTVLLILYTLLFVDFLCSQSITNMTLSLEYTITLTMSAEFCNLWWGSVLSVFYCVKITNYGNRFFMRLKMKISKMVPWLLLVSLVLSCLSSLPHQWFVISFQSFNGTVHELPGVVKMNWLNNFWIRIAGSFIPFVTFCISVSLLVASLLRHIRNLRSRGSGFSDAQRDIHLSVIQNMLSFLLLYVLYFIGSNLVPLSVIFRKHLVTVLCSILYVSFPSLHSISLIVSNKDLKNAFLASLRCSWIRDRALGR